MLFSPKEFLRNNPPYSPKLVKRGVLERAYAVACMISLTGRRKLRFPAPPSGWTTTSTSRRTAKQVALMQGVKMPTIYEPGPLRLSLKREQSISMVLFIPQAMGSSNNAGPAMIHLD
jgi:hypothetical protein